jgi:predicted N-acetyltransferase YhbS
MPNVIRYAVPPGHYRVRIRPAKREDIPAIVKVCSTSVSDAKVVGFGAPSCETLFGDVERLSDSWREPNRVGSKEVFVAEVDGQVVGCDTVEDKGEELDLADVDVSPDYQGRGIGTRLVRFVEERARELGKKAVTTGTSRNAAGVPWDSFPWWLALGYWVTREEENAWTRSIGPGVREIRMRKDLLHKSKGPEVREQTG